MSTKSGARFLLGANTSGGFYSLFDELCERDAPEELIVIKGGPGCGKSSLMRRVALKLENAGQAVEYIYCSGDPDTLDAVIFPERGVSIVDGTSPHVIEPARPGLSGRYLDMGRFYDFTGLKPHRDEADALFVTYKEGYERAFRYLAAAKSVRGEPALLLNAAEEKLVKRAKGIISREIKGKRGSAGTDKRRFLSGVTCKGHIAFFDTVRLYCDRVYELVDSYGMAPRMLREFRDAALSQGHNVISCQSPLRPEQLEHLIIPGLSLAFVTTGMCEYDGEAYRRVLLDSILPREVLRQNRTKLRFSSKLHKALIAEAVEALADARQEHDKLERLYNPHVDFDGVYSLAAGIAEELK